MEDVLEGYELECHETGDPGEAREIARGWSEGLLVVVGGDGTINEVVNGLGLAGFPEAVTLGIVPSGTGNDLAATLCVPEDFGEAARLLRQGEVRTLDAARIRSRVGGVQHFINVVTGGVGADISEAADGALKERWGGLAYLRGSLEAAREFEVRKATVTLDGEEREVSAVNVAIGNCRYAGGGWLAAPKADPEDGLLDLVVIEDVGLPEVLSLAPDALARADYLDNDGVFHARAREVRIDVEPSGLHFTADGDLVAEEPAEFTVVPRALKVIVGPGYSREA